MRLHIFMTKKIMKIGFFVFVFIIIICIIFLVRGGLSQKDNDINTERGEVISRDVFDTEQTINDGDPNATLQTPEAERQQERSQKYGKMEVADAVGAEAMDLYKKYNILPSVIVAKAMFESGFGIADVVDINNFFYLKYEKGCGTEYQIYTYSNESDEKDVGVSGEYTIAYRKYETLKDGIEDYEKYVLNKHPSLAEQNDYVKACQILDNDNSEELISLIEQYQFDKRYDSITK